MSLLEESRYTGRAPGSVSALTDLTADVGWLLEHIEQLQAAHELMAAQFRIMQQEKEHGWREAGRIEVERDVLRSQRQAVLDLCDARQRYVDEHEPDSLPVVWIREIRSALGADDDR